MPTLSFDLGATHSNALGQHAWYACVRTSLCVCVCVCVSQAQDAALQAELATLRNEASLALSTSAADTRAKQLAESEVTALTAKVTQQEGVINDLKQQLGTVSARLSATERALMDASGRVSELNSKLALTETDSRIKVCFVRVLTHTQAGGTHPCSFRPITPSPTFLHTIAFSIF